MNEEKNGKRSLGKSEHHIILKIAKRFESIYMEQ